MAADSRLAPGPRSTEARMSSMSMVDWWIGDIGGIGIGGDRDAKMAEAEMAGRGAWGSKC